MKRIISVFAAMSVILSLASCKKNEAGQKSDKQTYSAERLSNVAYRKTKVQIPDEIKMIYCCMPYAGSSKFMILGTGTTTPEFWCSDGTFNDFEKVEFPEFDIGVSYSLDTADDGTLVVFVNHADYGDLPAPDPSDPDYDSDKYDAAAEYSFMIKTYSEDGRLLTEAEVTDYPEEAVKISSIRDVYSDGELVIVDLNGSTEMFKVDGTYIGELKAGEDEDVEACGRDCEGRLVCAVTYKEDDVKKLKICSINSDGSLTENDTVYDYDESVQGRIIPGTGEYSLYFYSRSTIYGIRSEDSSVEALFSINATDLMSDEIEYFTVDEDGDFIILSTDLSAFTISLKKYTYRDPAELENLPIVKMSIYGEYPDLRKEINQFNDTCDDYRIELKEYSSDYENRLSIYDTISHDLLSGNIPDIMVFNSPAAYMSELDIASMDILCDLYDFIDEDDAHSRDIFVPNVLHGMEHDGKLLAMANTFRLNLGIVAKTKFVGDGSDWNAGRHLDLLENPPAGVTTKYYSGSLSTLPEVDNKRDRMSDIDWQQWVDFKNAECHFDDPDFVRYLKYCDVPELIEQDYSALTEEELNSVDMDLKWYEAGRHFIDDTCIFYTYTDITSPIHYTLLTKGTFNNEPITILGEKDNGEHGARFDFSGCSKSYGITKASEYKDFAWDFICHTFSDEHYSEMRLFHFPITKSAYKTYCDNACKPQDYSYDPDLADYHGLFYNIGNNSKDGIKVGECTAEDRAAVDELIANALPDSSIAYPSIDFYNIAYEEFDSFFNGACTAEKCAENLQDRLTIYLSEKYSK